MSQRQQLDDLIKILSQLKQYTWSFRIYGEFAKISCVSTSIEMAREQIIDLINKIDDSFRDYRKMTFETEEDEEEFLKKMPTIKDFDANICLSYISDNISFLSVDTRVVDSDNKSRSIKELIEDQMPNISDFKLINIKIYNSD
jgi:hypothetical protein